MKMEDFTFNLENGLYLRTGGHKYIKALSKRIADLYQINQDICLFPSGMAAISSCLLAISYGNRKNPGRFIFSSELYSDTLKHVIPMIESLTPHSCELVSPWNETEMQNLFKNTSPQIIGMFVESASNPNGYKPLWDLIPDWVTLIVDNSWLSPLLFNPFNARADVVVESLTKYFSAGTRFGGFVLAKSNNMTNRLKNISKTLGMHVPPKHAKEILELSNNLEERMKKISEKTKNQLIPFLKNHSKVNWYRVWENSKNETPYQYAGVVYFAVKSVKSGNNSKGNSRFMKKQWSEWCFGLSIKAATSYGKEYDLIDHWTRGTETEMHVRLSVGFKDNPKLIHDLDVLINRISS
ncbi:MAG: hypothetical protein GF364_21460 [Candidatus Lokiarchaeota archaeon]|nr:hypothetical protein [Candidatus Lokiarchaeota archaeon]